MGGCECLDWGPLQPAATLVTVPVPPGTSPAFEDELLWSYSGLSPWCSPEPLRDLSPVQRRLFLVTGSSFQPSQSLILYPLLLSHPLILPELLHCSIPPAAQAFVSESVHEGGDLAFQ